MGVIAIWQKIYKTLAALRTGIILLIVTAIAAAVGTVILQRPSTDPVDMQQAYSPAMLAFLDKTGFSDVYHASWFTILMVLVCISIVCASLERWPNAWRFYARPYRRPEPHFRNALPNHVSLPVRDTKTALEAAERAFSNLGLHPERIVGHDEVSIYSERHRFSVLAAYVIHASLLLLFAGWIIDSTWGYRGYVQINEGESANTMSIRTPSGEIQKPLPFTIRCDEAGQENYQDGTPKKFWSKLVILENGKELKSKTIVVNGPLDHRGIRLFQANFGMGDKLAGVTVTVASAQSATAPTKTLTLKVNGESAELDAKSSVRLTRFVPDFYIQDNEIFTRSLSPRNPAFEFTVTSNGQQSKAWLMPAVSRASQGNAPFNFFYADMKMANFTGLEASYQPGQWGIWGGILLMAAGLYVAFFVVHMRFWAIAVMDEKSGKPVLWVGGTFNKNKERFEERYNALIAAVKRELGEDLLEDEPTASKDQKAKRETTLAGV
jgi:cytochrome c biogenesis protein